MGWLGGAFAPLVRPPISEGTPRVYPEYTQVYPRVYPGAFMFLRDVIWNPCSFSYEVRARWMPQNLRNTPQVLLLVDTQSARPMFCHSMHTLGLKFSSLSLICLGCLFTFYIIHMGAGHLFRTVRSPLEIGDRIFWKPPKPNQIGLGTRPRSLDRSGPDQMDRTRVEQTR